MTSIQQREQLQSQIWKIANEVRGAVDGWDFKQFVLGTLFYRFISENFTDYIEGGDDSIDYASLPDSIITPEIKEDAVKTAHTNPNLNTDLKAIFDSIESSANGYASEKNIYIQSVRLNGRPYTKNYLSHEDILQGGTMEFVMGDKPNTVWGSASADCPPSVM